jgi:hypothetical protein
MDTPVGSFAFYEGSLIELHGVVEIVGNLSNGRLALQKVYGPRDKGGLTDVGRKSIRKASKAEVNTAQSLEAIRQDVAKMLDKVQTQLVDEELKGFAARQEKRRKLLLEIEAALAV